MLVLEEFLSGIVLYIILMLTEILAIELSATGDGLALHPLGVLLEVGFLRTLHLLNLIIIISKGWDALKTDGR